MAKQSTKLATLLNRVGLGNFFIKTGHQIEQEVRLQRVYVNVPKREHDGRDLHYVIPKGHLLEGVVFPPPKSDDKWELYAHRRMVEKFIAMFVENKHFSVCAVTDAYSYYGVSFSYSRHPIDKLRTIHCVDWSRIPPNLRAEIPGLLNDAFEEIRAEYFGTDLNSTHSKENDDE